MKGGNTFQELPNSEEVEPMTKSEQDLNHKKNSYKLDRKCLCVIALLCVFIFYISVFSWFFWYENKDLDNDSSISARLIRRRHHKRTCDDEEYGCCKIFTGCKVVGSRVSYKELDISVYRINSHDNFMSNCPSLETLINKYNRHYGNMSTDCGEYGCCPGINIDCDNAIRKSLTNGNNQGTVNTFLHHKEYKPILINKIDTEGSNCNYNNWYNPLFNVKKAYEDHYPEQDDDWVGWIIGLVSIILCLCWLLDL